MYINKLPELIFDNDIVKKLATPSLENFDNTIKNKNWTNSKKYDVTYDLHYEDVEKTILVIDFQCTKSVMDNKINLDFIVKLTSLPNSPSSKIYKNKWFGHGGFIKAYESVYNIFIEEIINNRKIKYIITRGFSQGSAYAILNYVYLKKYIEGFESCIKIYGIAYAAPRVIWLPFYKNISKYLKDMLIVKNAGDIVTHLPLLCMLFKHFGKVIIIGKKWKDILPLPFYHEPSSYRKNLELLK